MHEDETELLKYPFTLTTKQNILKAEIKLIEKRTQKPFINEPNLTIYTVEAEPAKFLGSAEDLNESLKKYPSGEDEIW